MITESNNDVGFRWQTDPVARESGLPSRRGFLGLTGGTLAAAGLAACTSGSQPAAPIESSASPTPDAAPTPGSAVTPTGRHQAGVTRPLPPQPNLLTVVYGLHGHPGPTLAALGRTVLHLTAGTAAGSSGIDPGDLTVTVGAGPRVIAAHDRSLPGAEALPAFAHEQLGADSRDGDLMVQFCASDPLVLPGALAAVTAVLGRHATERWRQRAFRGPNVPITATASAPRNLLGFVDGIIGPRTPAEFDADVWLDGPSSVAGGSIAVVRRMEIDLTRFLGESTAAQERIIGRRRSSAAPLSGGTIATDPDLGAKTPRGAYVIPADAHLRRANPKSTGVPPMLRRSYSFDDSASGLFFVSFQKALSTFVATLNRMSTMDALLDYTTTTRSGTFLVLPGFDASRPLGSTLFPG